MRICYLCPDLGVPLGGEKGASAHVRGLVQAFTTLNQDVFVVSPAAGGTSQVGAPVVDIVPTELSGDLKLGGDKPLQRALRHLFNNVRVESAVEEVLARYRPDLVYERYSPFGVAGGAVAARAGIAHILEVNAPLAWEGATFRRQTMSDVAQALERSAFETTPQIVAVSRELRRQLVAQGVARHKIRVVPNGVHAERFAAAERRPEFAGKFVIGFVGSLKPWHGLEFLIEAFRLLSGIEQAHLLVVGDGPMAKALQRLSQDLPGRITLAGAVAHERVPGYLRSMDIAVAPYPPMESFYYSPLKVLEYMAAGRAIVASRIGQVADLIEDGTTGLLVPPGDAAALAEAIRFLIEHATLREILGRQAAAEAKRAHGWTARARQILKLAEDLGGTARRPRAGSPGRRVTAEISIGG